MFWEQYKDSTFEGGWVGNETVDQQILQTFKEAIKLVEEDIGQ